MKTVLIGDTHFSFSSVKNATKFSDALASGPLHTLDIDLRKVKNVYHLFVDSVDLGKFLLKEYKKLLELQTISESFPRIHNLNTSTIPTDTSTIPAADTSVIPSNTSTIPAADTSVIPSNTSTIPAADTSTITRIQKFGTFNKIPSARYSNQFQSAIAELAGRQKTNVKFDTYRQTLNKLVLVMC